MTELHTIHIRHVPENSWCPAGVEPLPPGFVNVYLLRADDDGHEMYALDSCPGSITSESAVTEVVEMRADPLGSVFDDNFQLYAEPVVVSRVTENPPHHRRHYVDQTWLPADRRPGYLRTVRTDRVPDLLASTGHADARPDCR